MTTKQYHSYMCVPLYSLQRAPDTEQGGGLAAAWF